MTPQPRSLFRARRSCVLKRCSGTVPNCRSPRLTTRAFHPSAQLKKINPTLRTPPFTHTSFRQTLHPFRTAKNGIQCYQNRRQSIMLELVKPPWQLPTTAGLLPGPNTGAAPVHEEPLGPAQTLRLASRCTTYVSLVTPTTWNTRACTRGRNPHAETSTARLATTLEWISERHWKRGRTPPRLILP